MLKRCVCYVFNFFPQLFKFYCKSLWLLPCIWAIVLPCQMSMLKYQWVPHDRQQCKVHIICNILIICHFNKFWHFPNTINISKGVIIAKYPTFLQIPPPLYIQCYQCYKDHHNCFKWCLIFSQKRKGLHVE